MNILVSINNAKTRKQLEELNIKYNVVIGADNIERIYVCEAGASKYLGF